MKVSTALSDLGQPGFRFVPVDCVDLPSTPELNPGWSKIQAIIGDGVAVVELQHVSGSRADWYFDANGRQYGTLEDLDVADPGRLETVFGSALAEARDVLLGDEDRPVPNAVLELFRLGPRLRRDLGLALQAVLLPDPAHVALETGAAPVLHWADEGRLRQSLATNLQNSFVTALHGGVLTWPSPRNGAAMLCTGSFTFDDLNCVFRFRDTALRCDVFLLATEHLSRVAGLYVPAQSVVVTLGQDQARMLTHHLGHLGRYMIDHVMHYGDSVLQGRGRSEPMRFATFLRGGGSAHLGHQLWNELSAIDGLCAELPVECLPHWMVPGVSGNSIEFYGPIDTLFPEIANRVVRGFPDQEALIRSAYSTGTILFRAARDYVSDGLRQRVQRQAALYAPVLPNHRRAFIIGLRVENRTAVDLEGLCGLVIEEAMRLNPGCTIVFDGHNSRGTERSDDTIGSYREGEAARSPLMVERAVADAMRARFEGQDVILLDTLGDPLATSLAWCMACDGFVALWGAGLAKYRWVTNKPGLVITNHWNIQHKADLLIYNDPACMESPTPLMFVRGDSVQDVPDAPMLVTFDQPTYSNFEFDTPAMRLEVQAFFTALDGPAPVMAALARRSRPLYRHGSVDRVHGSVSGWAVWAGECPVIVGIAIDGKVIGHAVCDMPRPDLQVAGLGNGIAGFSFDIPDRYTGGAPHLLSVHFDDGVRLLVATPNTGDSHVFLLGTRP